MLKPLLVFLKLPMFQNGEGKMGSRHYQKSDKEHTRKRRLQVSDTDDWRSAESNAPLSPNSVMQLQRTIGNQAVQRLISGKLQRDNARNENSVPGYLAKITTHQGRKLKGDSTIEGFEGDIEVLAISTEFNNRSPEKSGDKGLTIYISKYVDSSSQWLLDAAAKGEHVSSVIFLRVVNDPIAGIRVAPGMQFGDGIVSNVTVGGEGPDGKTMEMISMDFPKGPS